MRLSAQAGGEVCAGERQPKTGMKLLKLALFDLDGTLTREPSAWEYIHRRLGVWDGHADRFQEAFLRGEISYSRFCELDAAIWKGMRVEEVRAILREIPLSPGLEELTGFLKRQGMKLGIISSGLSFLAEWIQEKYAFDFCVANELGFSDGVLNGEISIHVHYDRKGEWVEEARNRFNACREEVLAVGDSSGDIPMFQEAGFSIAFNCRSPELERQASRTVRSTDLRDLIPLISAYWESL